MMRGLAWWVAAALGLCVTTSFAAAPVEVRVMVLSPDGSPVSRGHLTIGGMGNSDCRQGRFVFRYPGLSPGGYPLAYSEFGTVALRHVIIPAEQDPAEVTVRLGEEVVVQGMVTGGTPPEPRPYAQVSLSFAAEAPAFPLPTEIIASEEGTFTLDGFAFRGVQLRARLPLHRPSEPVQPSPPYPARIGLYCPPETLIIGYVLDEAGSRIAEAEVSCQTTGRGSNIRADQEGRFEFDSLPPGRYRISACASYCAQSGTTIEIRGGQQVLGLVLRLSRVAQHTFFGRVVGPDEVTGVEGAAVTFEEHLFPQGLDGRPLKVGSGYLPEFRYTAVSDQTGYFGLNLPSREDDPPRHVWFPHVEAEGYVPRDFTVLADRESSEYNVFRMYRGSHLSGVLAGAPQGAVVEVEVRSKVLPPLLEPQSVRTRRAEYDQETGHFDFGLVQPGEHWLTVRQSGEMLLRQKVTVKEGEEATLALALPRS